MTREELEKKLEDLKAKQKLVEAAWKKAGNRDLLNLFVEILPKVVDSERCSIFVLDSNNDNVWVECGTGVTEKQISVPKGNSLVGRVISSGEPIIETDMTDQMGAHDDVAIKTGYVTYNALCVPVHGVTTDKVTGAIEVINKRGIGVFDDEDREMLEKVAFYLQMSIENLYLKQELAKVSDEMRKKIAMIEERFGKAPG